MKRNWNFVASRVRGTAETFNWNGQRFHLVYRKIISSNLKIVQFVKRNWSFVASRVRGAAETFHWTGQRSYILKASFHATVHSLLKVKISAHRPNFFANKCFISIHWIVLNQNIGLLGHLKTTPMPLIL